MKTYTQSPWSLSDLFPSQTSPEMEAAFAELERKIADFETLRPQLVSDITPETFLDLIHRQEVIYALASRIRVFSSLSFSADTQNQSVQTFLGRVDQTMARASNRLLFFELWWKALEDDLADRLLSVSGDYRYWLEAMRLFKPHTLSEAEEKIINLKDTTGKRAINQIYSTITNRYAFKVEVDGVVKEMTRGELMMYARHTDPQLRAAAYQELYRVYGDDGNLLGQMYQTLVRDWHSEQVELRTFASPISARNLDNDIPDVVVTTLLETCRKNTDLFQRYFRLKARWLGMERLRRYDIYAPVTASDKRYAFESAAEMVLDSFKQFDPQVASLAQRVFDQQHLDSEVRKGKRSGAFCASVTPALTPWVHINYQGQADDVATMAHELGHAIHSMLAAGHSLFTFHSSLPLAETASTFGEMLLIDRLMAQESDDSVRRDLLFKQMDDAYATIQRQAFFALFERQAHEMIQNGASVDEVATAYMANLNEQFGDALEVSEEFRWEWVSIPHIYHTPFYVYAYTFGQLLVFSLYQQFRAEGERFKPRYLKILSAGGSASPESILTQAGIDIRSASFWQGGFDVLRGLVEQLEQIPVEK
jgi:oligoendopeptidase F